MQWQEYSDKYSQLSTREQVLIAITGLVAIVFTLFIYVIEGTFQDLASQNKQNVHLINETKRVDTTIIELENALRNDPNEQLKQQIIQYQQKLAKIDSSLLKLTSELVDPVQMRQALEQLLHMQKGVKLVSFEVSGAEAMLVANTPPKNTLNKAPKQQLNKQVVKKVTMQKTPQPADDIGLYRHRITLKLSGSFFQLRDYLSQLEQLPWKFFWEKFEYKLNKYPKGELQIEIYSLSLKKEFIGV